MMCDPVREHRFRSCHTIYSVHLSMGDILDHPTLRRRVKALRRLRRTLTHRQLKLVPANIRATTRRYRKVRHTHITLGHAIVRQLCYPSNISPPIVVKLPKLHILFGAIFSTGASPSHIPRATHRENNMENSARKLSEERWRLSNRNPPPMARH